MIGKYFEYEADKNTKYYRVIQTIKKYEDGRKFPINKIVVSDKKINLSAEEKKEIGGFCISTYEYIFRWLIRGETLCEVEIPEGEKVYKTVSENGIYRAEKIILINPKKIDDDLATKLYLSSTLPEISYFKAMTACAICGYINTALRVCKDKVNKNNVNTAILELNDFCEGRNMEKYDKNSFEIDNINLLKNELEKIKEN